MQPSSEVIRRLGLEINDESSVYYWAAKMDIPVGAVEFSERS
jgi:deoxyhypusine synthase